MAELTSIKLDPEAHLLLDQPLLRLPNELLRKNLKSAQRQIEMTNKGITTSISGSKDQSPAETLASLDATLAKAQNLKRKLEALQTEERALHVQQKARVQHLQELHEIPSLADVKYDNWSQTRLDRLLVDYLLRQGHTQSAKELAREKGIEELVDIGVFDECGRIERSLREGKTQECLSWCTENKQALKKINVQSPCNKTSLRRRQSLTLSTEQPRAGAPPAAVYRTRPHRRTHIPTRSHPTRTQAPLRRTRRAIRPPRRRPPRLPRRDRRRPVSGTLQPRPLRPARRPLPQNPPRALCPARAAVAAHRPVGGAVCAQDALVSFRTRAAAEHADRGACLSDLLDGVE